MKKSLVILGTLVLLISGLSPARAVENGTDATGNSFVVPIKTLYENSKGMECSGTLIAPSIVVTAGHCVLDENGLLSKKIYVGLAGSSKDSISSNDLALSAEITSSFSNAGGGKVGDDDLAFIVLGKPQTLLAPIRLASETEISNFRTSASALKTVGYGFYSDTGEELVSYPKSFTGTFSSYSTQYLNSASMMSTSGNSCMGDSGAPILASTPSTVILVGILTGSVRSVKCTKKWTDGNFYTLFTLISRYSNLAFAAAVTQMNNDLVTIKNSAQALSDSKQVSDNYLTQRREGEDKIAGLEMQITILQDEITALKAKIPTTLLCVKGKLTQKVTAVSPKCPSGYKVKA